MKHLFMALSFLCFNAYGMTFSKYTSVPEHNLLQEFTFKNGQASFAKRTNYYDQKQDYRVGEFKTSSAKAESLNKRLKTVLDKVTKVDEFMKTKGTTFNDLSGKVPHEALWFVDSFKITKDSVFNSELEDILEELQALPWEGFTGLGLDETQQSVKEFKNGKVVSDRKLAQDECYQKEPKLRVCQFKGIGILYVK